VHGPQFDPAAISDQGIDEVARQGERVLAWLETAQDDLDRIIGAGETGPGQVKATVDANGRVLDIVYGQRSTRMDSRELAEETLAAVHAACEDARRQAHDLMREALPGYDPVEANERFQRLLTDWT
jgi:DNA-binding protein YbaB